MSREKHSPLIALAAARSRYSLAVENCPHWDYESDGSGHACCAELTAAQYELRQLVRRVNKVRAE